MTQQETVSQSFEAGVEATAPRYDLTDAEYAQTETDLAAEVRRTHGDTLAAVWLPTDSHYANAIRTQEAAVFPEIPEIMEPYERACKFLALVDTREGQGRIVHGYRVSVPNGTEETPEAGLKIAFIQDLVGGGEITEGEIADYYTSRGIDLGKSTSVETNFRIGERVPSFNGIPTPQVGYLALFNNLAAGTELGTGYLFAHLNRPAVISLGRLGIEYEPVAGNEALQTPTKGGEFDPHYKPVAIPYSAHNQAIFTQLAPLTPPTLHL